MHARPPAEPPRQLRRGGSHVTLEREVEVDVVRLAQQVAHRASDEVSGREAFEHGEQLRNAG